MALKVVVIPGLTIREISPTQLAAIKKAGQTEQVVVASPAGAHNELADADVVLGFLDQEKFSVCQRLKWVQSISSGVDMFYFDEFINSDVVLTSEKGLVGEHLADHAFGLLLTLTRQLKTTVLHGAEAWQHRAQMRTKMVELTGATMGIYGFGSTGRAMAQRARGFGMNTLALDCDPVPASEFVDKVWDSSRFGELLEQSDYFAVCTPLTNETRGVLDEHAFKRMRNTAVLVNVTRGEIMVEEDLIQALKTGEIAGAALDVQPREPLPSDSGLWDFDQVVMTPHTAGASQFRAQRNMDRFLRNLEQFVSQGHARGLEGQIDKERWF